VLQRSPYTSFPYSRRRSSPAGGRPPGRSWRTHQPPRVPLPIGRHRKEMNASHSLDSAGVTENDLQLSDGRTLHMYDVSADGAGARLAVFWHHGTPNIGAPPEPLLPAAAQRGIRWVSYDRPGYGGSTPHPGRDAASAAADVSSIADALGIGQFAIMGHSGGSAHALAVTERGAAVGVRRPMATGPGRRGGGR